MGEWYWVCSECSYGEWMPSITTACLFCGHQMCTDCLIFEAGGAGEPQKNIPSEEIGHGSDASARDSMSADHLSSTQGGSTSENGGIQYDVAMMLFTDEKYRSTLSDLLARFYDDQETLKVNLCW